MSEPIPLLYLAPSAGLGGAETFLLSTARHHDPARFRPVYALLRDGELADSLRAFPGISVRVAPGPPARLSRPASWWSAVGWLARLAAEEKAALLHSTMAYGALFGAPAALRAGRPHVWFQHGPVGGWMDRVAGALPARALLVNSTMTRAAQARIERGVPHVRRHVRILTLGTEERERSPARVSGRPLRVGMVCRFQAWKGIDLFLEAAVFARKAGADLVVTLWGGPTDAPDSRAYAEGLPARAEAAGVHLAGPVRDFRELRGCIDVIVNASLTPEPFGLTLIEGMSIGAVPVAPREGGPCEIIEEDRTGLFFAPRDARALGEVLTALAADPGYVARLSGDAWESARTRFSAGRMVRELETLYTELLSR